MPVIGQRVRLVPFEDCGEEFGKVFDVDAEAELVYVNVDRKYRNGQTDDGIREVPVDQVEVI